MQYPTNFAKYSQIDNFVESALLRIIFIEYLSFCFKYEEQLWLVFTQVRIEASALGLQTLLWLHQGIYVATSLSAVKEPELSRSKK